MRPPWPPALLRSLREGYGRGDLWADLSAGVLVGVVALPLAMALAIASGAGPEQGLYTAVVAGIVVGLFGGSRFQIAGPTGAFVGFCLIGIQRHGYEGLALATLMAGLLLMLMGWFRLGRAISYVPIPVVTGFTSGIAVVIASTQVFEGLGIRVADMPGEFVPRIGLLWAELGHIDPAAALLSLGTAMTILLLRRRSVRIPSALIALTLASLATSLLTLPVETIGSRFPALPTSLPVPAVPEAAFPPDGDLGAWFARLRELSGLAFTIAMLGAIECLLSAVVADGMTRRKHDPDMELVGQGLANLVSPLFRGLPVTGAIARTATNIRAGARSPVSSLVHSAVLLLTMLLAAPLLQAVPLAALSGVLFVVCWDMAEVRHWPRILRQGRGDAFLLPLTFLLTVLIDLVVAVEVGVLLGMAIFVRRMAASVQVEAVSETAGNGDEAAAGFATYEIAGPFFFGAATRLTEQLGWLVRDERVLVLRMRHVPFIDATAMRSLELMLDEYARRGVTVLLSGVRPGVHRALDRAGLLARLGPDRVFADFDGARREATELAASAAGAARSSKLS